MSQPAIRRRGPLLWLAARRWKFWIGLTGLSILYPASFGPACWITSRLKLGAQVLPIIYRPLIAMMPFDDGIPLWGGLHGGRLYTYPDGRLVSYAEWGADSAWHWRYVADYTLGASGIERTSAFTWEWADSTHY